MAKCAHQLLFMAPLSPILETVERATSRGYEALPVPVPVIGDTTGGSGIDASIHMVEKTPTESVFVPSATIKRSSMFDCSIYLPIAIITSCHVIIESAGTGMGRYGAPSFIAF